MDNRKRIERSGKKQKILISICILAVLLLILIVMYFMNQITEVTVEGNVFYTEKEIKDLVIDGELEKNAWYLYWKYNHTDVPEIPFVDKVEIELTGQGKVNICVYEKSITGYIEYLGSYMYFDKDGTVVESSTKAREDVPQIIGLEFDKLALSEKLQVKDEEVFSYILTLTKELQKNKIMPDKIQFNDELEATLYFGQARVLFGTDTNQNEKVTRLKSLIKDLEGKSGVLHMEEVDENNKNIVFEKDE